MQDELAQVREELARVGEELRPLRQQRREELAKLKRVDRLLDALDDDIRPLAAKEKMLMEEERAMRLKAQATGEQSFLSWQSSAGPSCDLRDTRVI